MKYVVICEKRVDQALAISNLSGGTIKFIAASPEACKGLDAVNIKYTDIEGYFPQEICNSDECYDKIYALCKDIDSKDTEYNPGMDNFYFIKMLYDALYIRAIALANIVKKEKPDRIVVFADKNGSPDSYFPFGNGDNIYELLLDTAFDVDYSVIERPEKVDIVHIDERPRRKKPNKQRKNRQIPPGLYGAAYAYKHMGIGAGMRTLLYTIRNRLRKRKILIFMTKYNYSWSDIIPQLYKRGYEVIPLETSSRLDIIPATENLESAKKYCKAEGVDFSEAFINTLKKRLEIYDREKGGIIYDTKQAIKKYKPYAFIGTLKTYREHIVARVASDHFVPVVTWQHGAAYPPSYSRMIPYGELMNSDIHFTFGPGYKEFKTFGCQIIPVGSRALYGIMRRPQKKKRKQKKKKEMKYDILYVTTNYNGNRQYSGANLDNKTWKAQKAILDTLMQYPSLRIAIKLHPSSESSHPIYSHVEGRTNIDIFKDEHYSDLLELAPTVIIDWPSTTLLEALAADKDVFVLSDQIKFTDTQKEMLKKRVYFAETVEEFTKLLKEKLMVPQSHDNMDFLLTYGVDPTIKPEEEVLKALKNVKKIGII